MVEIETHTENELDYSAGGWMSFKLLEKDLESDGKGPRSFGVRLYPEGGSTKQSNILR